MFPNSKKSSSNYRVLKKRYTDKLLDLLYDEKLSPAFFNSTQLAEQYKLEKKWLTLKQLFVKLDKEICLEIGISILKKAKNNDSLFLQFQILNEIVYHIGLFHRTNKKYRELLIEYKTVSSHIRLDQKLTLLYVELAKAVVNSNPYILSSSIENLSKRVFKLWHKSKDIDNYFIKFKLYNSLYFIYLIKNNTVRSKEVAKKAIKYFECKSGFSPIALFQFHQKLGISYLLLKDFDKAKSSFNFCFNYNPKKGSISWLYNFNYLFLTNILENDFIESMKIISMVINNYDFKKLEVRFRAPWYLKEAFIHFLIKTGKLAPEESPDHKLRAFRLSRFKNDVSRFNKDKRGLNITINIIEFLFLLIEGKHDKMLDKLQSLKQYGYKYLKKDEYTRPFTFIKLLLQIPEGNFEPELIRKKAARYQKILEENPLDYSEHAISIEIIPYEILWEEILSSLERSTAKTV